MVFLGIVTSADKVHHLCANRGRTSDELRHVESQPEELTFVAGSGPSGGIGGGVAGNLTDRQPTRRRPSRSSPLELQTE